MDETTASIHETSPAANGPAPSSTERRSLVASGLPGLDTVLDGGFTSGRAYQVRGRPGTGKTILAWHFLAAAGDDEPALLITFDEPEAQLRADASELGIGASPVDVLDLSPTSAEFTDSEAVDVFLPASDTSPVPEIITEAVEQVEPTRIVVDSVSHFRHLATDASQRRKQTLAFLRYLKEQDATILLLSEGPSDRREGNLHFLCDGIIELDRGSQGRSIQVLKQRGRGYREGLHSVTIDSDGMHVDPRLNPGDGSGSNSLGDGPSNGRIELLGSGVPEIDALMGGGIRRGTVSMISGASGVGKTTLGLQFMKEAAGRGERSVVFSFEEEDTTLIRRSAQVNIPVKQMIERDTLAIHQLRPWSFDPGRFAAQIRREVDAGDTSLVMLDSLGGFRQCNSRGRPEEQIHRVCKYLVGRGVTVILVNEISDITGNFRVTEDGLSHLADNLIFLRYLEMRGTLRKAIGVLKKRTGDFEKKLREFQITEYGVKVGAPLTQLRGILTGTPEWVGDPGERTVPMDRTSG